MKRQSYSAIRKGSDRRSERKQLLRTLALRKTLRVKKPATAPAASETALTQGLRRYLYLTAAITGGAIMIVEILGAKMLSPYVGLSHFVWTAQIAVTLVALATGYYFGGRLADHSQQLARLYWAIVGAAAYLAITVLICKPVAYWCLDFNLAVGSLLASTILFFIPLALLAMTGPFLIRVLTSTLAGVGANVGRLTSVSTLGSFAGTMLIGYFMVPFLPNSVTMYLTALALMLTGAGYLAVHQRRAAGPLAVMAVFAAATGWQVHRGLNPHYRWVVEHFRGNSHFGQLQVFDSPARGARYYLNDFLTQNTYDPARKQSVSHFTYMLAGLARAYSPGISNVLCIGMGVGIVPMDFVHQGARVDVVEINAAIVPVATRYFDFEPQKVGLTIDDGRHFLNRCPTQYDAVVLDAFLGDSSPSHLLTREAFTAIHRVLRANGVLTINVFGNVEEGKDYFAASLNKTLKSVFESVRVHTSGDGGLFFVASDRAPLEFLHPPQLEGLHPQVAAETREAYETVVDTDPEHGRILTDDYNPVEFFDAHNREDVRRRLAVAAKDL